VKSAFVIAEAAAFAFVIMVVALSSAAVLIHSLSDQTPEYRADLTVPPSYIICQQDSGGHCWVKGH